METTPILPTLLSAVGIVAAVLPGVWGIVARYAARVEDRMERMRDRSEQLGQLRERMAKLKGLLEGLREAITGKRAA